MNDVSSQKPTDLGAPHRLSGISENRSLVENRVEIPSIPHSQVDEGLNRCRALAGKRHAGPELADLVIWEFCGGSLRHFNPESEFINHRPVFLVGAVPAHLSWKTRSVTSNAPINSRPLSHRNREMCCPPRWLARPLSGCELGGTPGRIDRGAKREAKGIPCRTHSGMFIKYPI
jgi:hypothetical protein